MQVETGQGHKLVGLRGGSGSAFAEGSSVDIFVRPGAISIRGQGGHGPGENIIAGTIDSLLFNGADSRVLVRAGEGDLVQAAISEADARADFRPGQPIELVWQHRQTNCFPVAG